MTPKLRRRKISKGPNHHCQAQHKGQERQERQNDLWSGQLSSSLATLLRAVSAFDADCEREKKSEATGYSWFKFSDENWLFFALNHAPTFRWISKCNYYVLHSENKQKIHVRGHVALSASLWWRFYALHQGRVHFHTAAAARQAVISSSILLAVSIAHSSYFNRHSIVKCLWDLTGCSNAWNKDFPRREKNWQNLSPPNWLTKDA